MRTFTKTSRWIGFLIMLVLSVSAFSSVRKDQLPSRKLRNIARLYMAYGQYDKAEGYLLQALHSLQSEESSQAEKAICLIDLATLYSYQDRLAQSEELFLRGLAAQQNALGPEHPYVAHTLRNLTAVYIRMQQLDRAAETLEWAFDIILQHHLPENRVLTPFYIDQAILLTHMGSYDEAEILFLELFNQVRTEFGQQHLYSAQIHKGLAELYLQTGQYASAASHLQSLLEIQQTVYGRNHQILADSYLLGARISREQGDLQQMKDYFNKALAALVPSGDLIAVARLYEQMESIRSADTIAAAPNDSNPEANAG